MPVWARHREGGRKLSTAHAADVNASFINLKADCQKVGWVRGNHGDSANLSTVFRLWPLVYSLVMNVAHRWPDTVVREGVRNLGCLLRGEEPRVFYYTAVPDTVVREGVRNLGCLLGGGEPRVFYYTAVPDTVVREGVRNLGCLLGGGEPRVFYYTAVPDTWHLVRERVRNLGVFTRPTTVRNTSKCTAPSWMRHTRQTWPAKWSTSWQNLPIIIRKWIFIIGSIYAVDMWWQNDRFIY